MKYAGHLLRCCAQINPQRIKDTPAVNLCSRLVSTPSISKGAGEAILVSSFWRSSTYQHGHGCPWFHAVAMFLWSKNSRQEVYTDVHFLTGYFKRRWQGGFTKPLLKILNVSARTRMSVVWGSSEFAVQTCSPKMYTDVHFWAGMYVVPRSNKFASQTCISSARSHFVANVRKKSIESWYFLLDFLWE